jgi:hypothetical protein
MHITKDIIPHGKIQASFQYQPHVLTKTKPHKKTLNSMKMNVAAPPKR